MESLRHLIDPLVERLAVYLPNSFVALVILFLGWLLALIIGRGAAKLMRLDRLDERLEESTGGGYNSAHIASKLVYYIVILFVFLLVLDILGVEGALKPLWSMLEEFLAMLPNVVAAILMGYIGYVIAQMASTSISLIARVIDPLSSKFGLGSRFSFSKLIGKVVFVIIFIPILIAALNALEIKAISEPAIQMLETFFKAIPQMLFAALILLISYFLGRFISSNATAILKNMSVDNIPQRIGLKGLFKRKTSLSKLCGSLIFFFVMLGASIATAEQLGLKLISEMISKLTVFLGQVALGVVTLAIGNFIANLAYKFFSHSAPRSILPATSRIVILGLVLAMGLRAMGIADDIVNLAFGLSLGACAIAVALSFGLGGREAAGKQMEYWLQNLRNNENEKSS